MTLGQSPLNARKILFPLFLVFVKFVGILKLAHINPALSYRISVKARSLACKVLPQKSTLVLICVSLVLPSYTLENKSEHTLSRNTNKKFIDV